MIGKQMAFAKRVLSVLEEAGYEVIIAGGAPRDWLLGNTATDIDVYIQRHGLPHSRDSFEDLGFTQVESLSTRAPDGADNSDIDSYSTMEGLMAVYNSRYVGNNLLNVQLIQVAHTDLIGMVTSNFPDICQAWLATSGSPLSSSGEFIEAHQTQTCEYRVENRHIEKMQLRFPTYTFTHRPETIYVQPSSNPWETLTSRAISDVDLSIINSAWRNVPQPVYRPATVSATSIQPDFF